MVPQALEHGGLAGAHLSGEHDETLAALDTVGQVRQRLLVLRAAVQEGRIGAQVERVFGKAEEGVIHGEFKRPIRAATRTTSNSTQPGSVAGRSSRNTMRRVFGNGKPGYGHSVTAWPAR